MYSAFLPFELMYLVNRSSDLLFIYYWHYFLTGITLLFTVVKLTFYCDFALILVSMIFYMEITP